MTHTYAAKRLLEHGPLTLREMAQITGWGYQPTQNAIRQLLATELVKRVPGRGRYAYALA